MNQKKTIRRKNRLKDILFDHDELARLLDMTTPNFKRQIINNGRELNAGELFIIAEYLKIPLLEVLEVPQLHVSTVKNEMDLMESGFGYRHRLVAHNDVAEDWIKEGLQERVGELEADVQAGKSGEPPYLPLVPGRVLLGRAPEQGEFKDIGASRRFSLIDEDNQKDLMISRLHLEILSCPEAPEIMLYLHGPIIWESEGDTIRRSKGQSVSMTNGDLLHLPNGAILQLDVPVDLG